MIPGCNNPDCPCEAAQAARDLPTEKDMLVGGIAMVTPPARAFIGEPPCGRPECPCTPADRPAETETPFSFDPDMIVEIGGTTRAQMKKAAREERRMDKANVKRWKRESAAPGKQAARDQFRRRMACFWTWFPGHVYEDTPSKSAKVCKACGHVVQRGSWGGGY